CEQGAAPVVPSEAARINLQCLVITGLRFFASAQCNQGITLVVPSEGVSRFDLQRVIPAEHRLSGSAQPIQRIALATPRGSTSRINLQRLVKACEGFL